jgi:DNA-binding CsgD family transcriptional regulator
LPSLPDPPSPDKVDSALALVKQLCRTQSSLSLPGRLLAITTPFDVEFVCAGLLPSLYCQGEPGICYETDRMPRLLPARRCSAEAPKPDILYFARQAGSTDPTVSVADPAVDQNNWRPGKGLIFPGSADDRGLRGIGFFGPSLGSDEVTKMALAFFAHSMMDRMLLAHPIRLPRRQMEALRWAAEGKTDHEIARILGISEHTVDKYMRQSKEALDAANRTATIVRAIRYGLIA